jgi:alkaline phosphatase D
MQHSHPDRTSLPDRIGPILHMRGHGNGRVHLAALLVVPSGAAQPAAIESACGSYALERIGDRAGFEVLRCDFSVPDEAGASYALGAERFALAGDLGGDLRVAYVSCNGQEHGDLGRDEDERDRLWQRLKAQHGERPFHLMLHGGDQLYADELTEAHPASLHWPRAVTPDLDASARAELAEALAERFFLRYLEQMSKPAFAWLAARVPSLAMWDDHDICDGWGSLKAWKLDSEVGKCVFQAARTHFLLFQLAAAADEVPPICLDPQAGSLTWSVALPGLNLIAPDLRSERRPERVMGQRGWEALERALATAPEGRTLILSSVPALGPRLSLVERVMHFTPWMEKYEDDLRDQWQSRAHRPEWCRFLRQIIGRHERAGSRVTVVSGEIHLASRGTMATAAGDIHQLIASGITHPAPARAYARALGALARLGEAPLPEHPIRMQPLPGQRGIYTAERNYLVLERVSGEWRAFWELEISGTTPALPL